MYSLFRSRKLDNLFEQRRERLFRIAISWCHDAMQADDLVQDTLGKALLKSNQLSDVEKVDAWLFRILHNTWMEYLRRHKPTLDLDDFDERDRATPENTLMNQQLTITVRSAVAELSMSQRQVITLIDLEGFAYAEVAEILDIPIGTVMSRLSRARNSLKKSLIGLRKEMTSANQKDYLRRVK